jgi:predicted TIM-barrel fold metal-dependent hydrolase
MRVTTLEEHFLTVAMAARLAGGPAMSEAIHRKLAGLQEERLADMDAGGIDVQMIAHTVPGTQAYDGEEEAVALARDANDRLAAAVRRHPERRSAGATGS